MVKLSYGLKVDTSGRLRKMRIHRGVFIVGHGCLIVTMDEEKADEILTKAESDNE